MSVNSFEQPSSNFLFYLDKIETLILCYKGLVFHYTLTLSPTTFLFLIYSGYFAVSQKHLIPGTILYIYSLIYILSVFPSISIVYLLLEYKLQGNNKKKPVPSSLVHLQSQGQCLLHKYWSNR